MIPVLAAFWMATWRTVGRPSTGVTPRPNTGTTSRTNTGTTGRP